MKKFVTTPIFYPNGKPHVGHLYSVLLLDVQRRLNILFDEECFCTTGLDEHGQKVFLAAMSKGLAPDEYVNLISEHFLDFFKSFNIGWDHWVSTSDSSHEQAVQEFWKKLVANGYIYKSKYSGFYSIREEAYIGKNEVVDDKDIIWQEEECYYFKLSAFENKLKEYFEQNKDFIYPKKRYNEVIGFLNQGLKDFAVSRPRERLHWGIAVPDDPEQVVYVWVDALVNYLSSIGYPDKSYKETWPAFHILGKDILKFHGIYWPALLMAAEVDLPKKLIVHGWWLNDDQKISKSYDNGIELNSLVEKYQVDGIRYFLLQSISLGEDGHFSQESIQRVVYGFLANKFGNIFLRVMGLCELIFHSKLPEVKELVDLEFASKVEKFEASARLVADDLQYIDEYISDFAICVESLNDYFQTREIWKMLDRHEQARHLYFLLDMFRKISLLIWPVMPGTADEILAFFELKTEWKSYSKELIYEYPANRPKFFPKRS